MGSPHYTPSGAPTQGAAGASADIRSEFTAIEAGLDVLNEYPIAVLFSDLNTAGQVYISVPWNCTVERVYIGLNASNSTADTNITLKINGTAVTSGTGVVLSTAVQGDVVTITPTALNNILIANSLEIESDGGGSGTLEANVIAVFKRT